MVKLQIISWFGEIVFGVLKIVLLIIILPFFLAFVCPIYLWRVLVLLGSKIIRPDLVTMLKARDTFYAVDKIYENPRSSIVITLVCKGDLTREMMIKNLKQALNRRKYQSKELLYPELKRYLTQWMGFIFWKDDKNFSVEKHIEYINVQQYLGEEKCVLDEDVIKALEKKIVQEPYPSKTSPWAFKILQNYQPKEFSESKYDDNGNLKSGQDERFTALLFKVHHSFVDGYSLMHFFIHDVMQIEAVMSKPSFPHRSFFQNLVMEVVLLFKAPYDILSEALMISDKNPMYLKNTQFTHEICSATSQRISSQLIKEIAAANKVSFSAIVIAAISSGIRRYMRERGDNCDKKTFSCLAPFPVPNHPETLGNYLSDCYISFPVSEEDDKKRLALVHSQLNEIKHSTTSMSSFVMQPVFGALFSSMVDQLMAFSMSKTTGIFSSLPGPRGISKSPSGDIVDCYFTCGHDNPGIGLQFLAFNYAGGWKLKIQADKNSISSDDEVERLLSHIVQALYSYKSDEVV